MLKRYSKQEIEELKTKWAEEQEVIARELILEDRFEWTFDSLEEALQGISLPRGGAVGYRTPSASELATPTSVQASTDLTRSIDQAPAYTAGSTSSPANGEQTGSAESKTSEDEISSVTPGRPPKRRKLRYVAGVDISFFGCNSLLAAKSTGLIPARSQTDRSPESPESEDEKGDQESEVEMACASLVIQRLPDFKTVYQDYVITPLSVPYVSGFLAFREVPVLLTLFEKLKLLSTFAEPGSEMAQIYPPDLVFTDGNGTLHPRGCGIASHLGYALGIPTIGVAKKITTVDGINRNTTESLRREILANLEKERKGPSDGGSESRWRPLVGESGRTWGAVVLTSKHSDSTVPVFVSPGHMISLETAVKLAQLCSLHRIVEPIRAADLGSREFVRRFLAQRVETGDGGSIVKPYEDSPQDGAEE